MSSVSVVERALPDPQPAGPAARRGASPDAFSRLLGEAGPDERPLRESEPRPLRRPAGKDDEGREVDPAPPRRDPRPPAAESVAEAGAAAADADGPVDALPAIASEVATPPGADAMLSVPTPAALQPAPPAAVALALAVAQPEAPPSAVAPPAAAPGPEAAPAPVDPLASASPPSAPSEPTPPPSAPAVVTPPANAPGASPGGVSATMAGVPAAADQPGGPKAVAVRDDARPGSSQPTAVGGAATFEATTDQSPDVARVETAPATADVAPAKTLAVGEAKGPASTSPPKPDHAAPPRSEAAVPAAPAPTAAPDGVRADGAAPLPPAPGGAGSPSPNPAAAALTAPRAPVAVERIPFEITSAARERTREIEIRLDPPDLGRVEVTIDVDGLGKVTTRLVVERSETLDQLRRDAPGLERMLNDAGLKTDSGSLQFSLREHGGERRHGEGGRRSKRGVALIETGDVNAWRPPERSLARPSGLDVRI
jgi:hypothetical protein